MQRSLQYVGLSLVVLGAMLTVVPTGSFSTIAGDRPVDVAVAGDGDAFLAIIDTNNEVTQPGSRVTVAELENNLNSTMTIEYEASVGTDSLSVANPAATATIRQGGREPLEVTCSPPNGGSGTATLTVDVIEASGRSATITDATLEAPVEYDCPGRTAGNQPVDPGAPPGDAVAYVDSDHDYAYDKGERIVPRGELRSFDNDSAHLVVAAGGETLDYRNRKIEIGAKSITVGETTFASNREIKLEAESDAVSLKDTTIDAKNGEIEVTGPTVTAGSTTVTSNREVKLEAESGPLTFRDSTADPKNGKLELAGRSIAASRSTFTTNREIKLEADAGSLSLADATVDSTNGKIELKGRTIDAGGASVTTNTEIKLESEVGELDVSDATVDSTNGKIELKGGSITADGASITTNTEIKLEAESGSISLTGSTVDSTNGKIEVKSGGRLSASSAVFDTNREIKLTSSGDMTLDGTEISSTNGQATLALGRASATLSVDNAVLQDRDSTVAYSPSGVGVTGTPATGSVQAG